MKRQLVRIEDVADIGLLREGWKNATKPKKYWRKSVKNYEVNLERNLLSLSRRLREGKWRPSSGRTFKMITEGKWREITSFPVEDCIVHYALVKVFKFSRYFIRRTHGSIKGRGCLSASKQVRRDIRRLSHNVGYENVYVVKYDCKKFYLNISKSRLKEKILKKYKGSAAIELLFAVIDSYMLDSETGISIGALTSQDQGNYFLTALDYFALQTIFTRYYNRYVDDITTLWCNKAKAVDAIGRMIEAAAKDSVIFGRIELYPLCKRRVDFCGYAINLHSDELSTRMRPKTVRRYIRRLHLEQKRRRREERADGLKEASFAQTIASYEGIAVHADTTKLLSNLKNKYYEIYRTAN